MMLLYVGRVVSKVKSGCLPSAENEHAQGASGTKLGSGAGDSWDLITPTACSILKVESRGRVSPG